MNRLKLLVRADFRERYSSFFAWAGEATGVYITLLLYSFTAAAFSPNFQLDSSFGGARTNYFDFILIGEITLTIPMLVLVGCTKFIRTLSIHHALDEVLLHESSGLSTILIGGISEAPRHLLHIATTVIFAVLFFHFHVSPLNLLFFLAIQIAFFPVFVGFGMILTSIFCFFGRGWKVIASSGIVLSILSGAYFPTTVLPQSLQSLTLNIFPHTALIQASRGALSAPSFREFAQSSGQVFLIAIFWSAVFLGLGFFLLKQSLSSLRTRPLHLLIRD